MVYLEIPGLPPSVNHYVRHAGGRHYRIAEARRWDETVAAVAAGKRLPIGRYRVDVFFHLRKGQRGDIDNFSKATLDALVRCGVIASDAKVDELYLRKFSSDPFSAESRTVVLAKLVEKGKP